MKDDIGLWRAKLETENFTFEAYGKSKWASRRALVAGLIRHAQEYRIPDTWWSSYRDDINFLHIDAGRSYRDGEALPPVEYAK